MVVIGAVEMEGFRDCKHSTRIEIEIEGGVENEEQGTPVWTCAGTTRPWSELWPELERLG